MTVEPSAGPAYQRIAESLRQTVLRSPDAEVRLPTEAELAQQYGVSRQTVRRAYQELVADGLVTRTPGRGSFAARDGSQYLRRFGTVEDLMSLSVDTEMEVLAPLARRIDIEAAGRLGLSSDAVTTVSFRRLHLGVPFCVTDVFLPPDVGSLIADAPEVQRGARSSRTIIGLLDPFCPIPSVVRTRPSPSRWRTPGWPTLRSATPASRCCGSTGCTGPWAAMPSSWRCRGS